MALLGCAAGPLVANHNPDSGAYNHLSDIAHAVRTMRVALLESCILNQTASRPFPGCLKYAKKRSTADNYTYFLLIPCQK